jgi:nucleoside 2-deoxyribosyltransferase
MIFVVMPFGPDWSRNVYDMIGQACQEVATTVEGLTWQRADEIAAPERITGQIVNAIETADIIVADLSGNNPNVMFELGYADRAEKEVVLLNQEIDATPFDIKDWRQIRYDIDDLGAGRDELVTFVRGALSRKGYR